MEAIAPGGAKGLAEQVVVSGAFGYLGSALVGRLWRHTRVVAVGHAPRLEGAIPPERVHSVYGDMESACAFFGPHTSLVHLAGGGGGESACRKAPALAASAIALGTSRIVAAAREAGVRRSIFASTISVYGTHRSMERPYMEDDTLAPDDLYGALKAAAEHVFVSHGGGVALRFANLYGAGSWGGLGTAGAAERFASAAAAGGELTVFGDGSQKIDYVHADDAVDAIVLALDAPQVPSVLNVGGGAPVSILELAETCVRAASKLGARPRIKKVPAPEGKVWPDRSLSIELARRSLGWRPRVPFDEGVKDLVGRLRRAAA
jgi:nucleoside-diphosphate-sugar epimerase